ncbi:MAG: hypothetical protein NTY15_17585 [Planctomycetota bacterium]|nr:hypothetical protein [Planctomycetota bacterium]
MPIHIDMLSLVGYESEDRDMVPAKNLNAQKRAMMSGLHSLRRTTNVDFGFDAAAWRDFLIESGNEFGYTHPFAYRAVDKAVQNALENPDVQNALAILEVGRNAASENHKLGDHTLSLY